MRIKIAAGRTVRAKKPLILPVFSERSAGTRNRFKVALAGIRISERLGERTVIADAQGTTIVISMGSRKDFTIERARRVGGSIASAISANGLTQTLIDMTHVVAAHAEDGVHALCEGIELGSFRFDRHKTNSSKVPNVSITLCTEKAGRKLMQSIKRAQVVASATNYARTLSREPANVINPLTLASRARSLAKATGLKCRIIDHKQMDRMKMGAMLSVGKASDSPPRLIVLEYVAPSRSAKPLVLVGKAITFDTGGYSLKDKGSMVGMKYDKCGGMAVMGVMQAVAALKPKTPVVGIIAAAENMIAGNAYRPNDIITSMSGKTIEIISTDAEGRMVLADALTYTQKNYKPRAIIDLATLTGGVVIALGSTLAGVFCNNDDLRDRLLESGERTFERLWPLPMHDEYFDLIKSDDCDFKNSGSREAHASVGAIFLKQFVDQKIPWAHLDIAGVAATDKGMPYCPKGGTGFGVRLLCDYIERL